MRHLNPIRFLALICLLTVGLLPSIVFSQNPIPNPVVADALCDRTISCSGSIEWAPGVQCNLAGPNILICRPASWWTCTPGGGAAVVCTGTTNAIPPGPCAVTRFDCW